MRNDLTAQNVVGSPYWSKYFLFNETYNITVAPEVIELSGATTSSDIWSLGATLIELLTGSPPYAECAPLSAMFRIVQDESIPLPPGLSAGCRDFLTECFQKDKSLRRSAKALRGHVWLRGSPVKVLPRSHTFSYIQTRSGYEVVRSPISGKENRVIKVVASEYMEKEEEWDDLQGVISVDKLKKFQKVKNVLRSSENTAEVISKTHSSEEDPFYDVLEEHGISQLFNWILIMVR